jgi:hypothetical protein
MGELSPLTLSVSTDRYVVIAWMDLKSTILRERRQVTVKASHRAAYMQINYEESKELINPEFRLAAPPEGREWSGKGVCVLAISFLSSMASTELLDP